MDVENISAGINARADHFRANAATMSMKACRRDLEATLGLEPKALDVHKKLIERRVLSIIQPSATKESDSHEAQPNKKRRTKTKETGAKADPAKVKRPKADKSSRHAGPKSSADVAAGPRVYGPGIRKLKRLCARATIKVPPSTYRSTRSESDIEGALLKLLHKHKLGVDAKDSQLLRVKAKLEQARELEGIDTSNIVEDGRRGRRTAAPTINYAAVDADTSGSGSGEEEEEDHDGQDSDTGSPDAEEGSEPAGTAQQSKQAVAGSCSDDDADDSSRARSDSDKPSSPGSDQGQQPEDVEGPSSKQGSLDSGAGDDRKDRAAQKSSEAKNTNDVAGTAEPGNPPKAQPRRTVLESSDDDDL